MISFRLKLLKKIAAGNAPDVSINYFPSVIKAWEQNNVTFIKNIIDILNDSIYSLTDGKTDFSKLKQQNFSIDISQFNSPIKNIVAWAIEFYSNMLSNDGKDFDAKLEKEQRVDIVNKLKQNQLFTSIPDGGINQELSSKIGGNFKTMILNELNAIK